MKKALLIDLILLHACPTLCVEGNPDNVPPIGLDNITDNILIDVPKKEDEAELKLIEKKPLWRQAAAGLIIVGFIGGIKALVTKLATLPVALYGVYHVFGL